MSGWNKRFGWYELTSTKAHWWARLRLHCMPMEFFASVLRERGLEVPKVERAWLAVRAPESQVYGAIALIRKLEG